MNEMKPIHPGVILYSSIVEDRGLTIKDFAQHLGFSRETVSRVLHAKSPVTANLALSLEEAGISSARMWLSLQMKYDLWHLKAKRVSKVQPLQFSETQNIAHV